MVGDMLGSVSAAVRRYLGPAADIVGLFQAFVGGGLMTYFAYTTEWLASWGPVGWGAVGLIAFVSIQISSAIAGRHRAVHPEAIAGNRTSAPEDKHGTGLADAHQSANAEAEENLNLKASNSKRSRLTALEQDWESVRFEFLDIKDQLKNIQKTKLDFHAQIRHQFTAFYVEQYLAELD